MNAMEVHGQRHTLEMMKKFMNAVDSKSTIPTIDSPVSRCAVMLIGSQHLDGHLQADERATEELTAKKVINWWRGPIRPLYPLRIVSAAGQRVCSMFLVAVSLAMWGFSSGADTLQRLVNVALVEAGDALLKDRWVHQRLRRDQSVHNRDWEAIKGCVRFTDISETEIGSQYCTTTIQFPQPLHIFALANVLKRSIVILESPEQSSFASLCSETCHFSGIYLPLLQPYQDCVKSPLVFVLHEGALLPLVGRFDDASPSGRVKAVDGIPLVSSTLLPLQIQFLSDSEVKDGHHLLQKYLDVTEINLKTPDSNVMILTAKLAFKSLDETLDNIVQTQGSGARDATVRAITSVRNGGLTQSESEEELYSVRQCETAGCKHFGVRVHNWRCSACHEKAAQAAQRSADPSAQGMNAPGNDPDPSAPPASIVTFNSGFGVPAAVLYNESASSMMNVQCLQPGCGQFVSRHTTPFCYDHVGNASRPRHEEYAINSIIDQGCMQIGCHNKASRQVFPMCHEHANIQVGNNQIMIVSNAPIPVAPTSISPAPSESRRADPPVQNVDSLFSGMMNDLESRTKRTTTNCKAPGCRNFGNSRCRGYCHDCFATGLAISQ